MHIMAATNAQRRMEIPTHLFCSRKPFTHVHTQMFVAPMTVESAVDMIAARIAFNEMIATA